MPNERSGVVQFFVLIMMDSQKYPQNASV